MARMDPDSRLDGLSKGANGVEPMSKVPLGGPGVWEAPSCARRPATSVPSVDGSE
jgi:hypothetical protein